MNPAAAAVAPAVWILSCEVADELPGVTVACEKVAVAPGGSPLAERATGLEKVPFCAAMVMEYWATAPGWTVCEPVVEVTVKLGAGVPVPLSVVVCGEPAALSVTESVAEKLPAAPGAKVMEMVQASPAASVVPQVVALCAKLLALDPVMLMAMFVSAALPVLEIVAICAAEVTPATALKLSDDGASKAMGAGAGAKFAVTLCAAFIVTVVVALLALATLPVQLLNRKPVFAVAERLTTVPAA
jgi:hypothetical protein